MGYLSAARACQSRSLWGKVALVLRDMREADLPVSRAELTNAYKPALKAFMQEGRSIEASALFEHLIGFLAKAGQWKEILMAFHYIEKSKRDVYIYTSAMRALTDAGSPVEEVLALRE